MPSTEIPLGTIQQVQSLRSSVTEALRNAIILGDLEEGELYSAPALAAPLGVSATPVREAMMDLAREGLVTTAKNKGFRVTSMTSEDLEEQTQVPQLLEGPAMRAVAGRIPAEDLQDLRRRADVITEAAETGDLRTYITEDRAFHAALVAHTRNSRLVDLTLRLRGQTRMRALRALADSGRLTASAQEHQRLLDLLEAGDSEGAYELTIQHIGHASRLWATGAEETGEKGIASPDSQQIDLVPRSARARGGT